jgi:uncharacterized protein DUF1570
VEPAHVEAATKATVRLALARGYLVQEDLRQALLLKDQLAAAGRPANLLSLLASRYLRADHVPELSEYYQRQLAAQAASPSGSAPPAEVEAPKIEQVEAPEDLLARSVELVRRPPEEDPQSVQNFMRESAKALQVQPAEEQVVVPDKIFVALAKRAGYPSHEDLVTCRRLQLERVKAGERITLFEVVQERGVLPERRIKRFQRWAAQVTRRDPAPLEDEVEETPTSGGPPISKKVMVHMSAAALDLPKDVDGEINAGPGAGPVGGAQPAKQKKGRVRRAANAVRDSASLVVKGVARRVRARANNDPEVASRQMVLFAGAAGVMCAIFGLALGLLLGTSDPDPQLAVASPTAEDPAEVRRREYREKQAKALAKGNADWLLLREVQPEDAPKLLEDFARKHPRDPRARHASRFAKLLEGERDRRERQQTAYLGALLERAGKLEGSAPRASLDLYELVVALAPRSAEAGKARSARRRLAERAISEPEPGPSDPLVPEKPAPERRPQKPVTSAERENKPVEAQPIPSGFALWSPVCKAYDDLDLPALERAVAALLEKVKEGHFPLAAKGLLAFAKEDFEAARDFLAPLHTDEKLRKEAKPLYRPWPALVRSSFYTKRYELAREVALGLSSERQRKVWLLLIDGPFAAEYPLSSPGLTTISPEGNYRVMADVGVTDKELRALEKKMRGAGSPAKLERLQAKLRKGHKILGTLGEVLDKAFMAYGKLLKVKERKAVYPTVYVFKDREGFAEFGRAIGIGSTENALGYYMGYYRILVFYEQTEDVKLGLSRDTVETLLHEAFHQWIHLHVRQTPAWFNEGMAEYFSIGAKITRKRLAFAVVPQRYPSRLSNIQDALRGASYLSKPWTFKRLARSDHSTFMTSAGVNYAHAWSMVHYLGSSPKGRKLLVGYFKALTSGASRKEAFDQVFGDLDLEALDADWKRYALNLK